jgi:hypothetical protein
MDLILVARCLLTQLTVEAYQLARLSPLVRLRIEPARASPAGNGHGIEAIRFGSQALTLVKLMRLSRMEQAEPIASLVQFVIEILALAGSRLHPNQDLTWERIQVTKLVQHNVLSVLGIGKDRGLDHQTFVRSVDTACTAQD